VLMPTLLEDIFLQAIDEEVSRLMIWRSRPHFDIDSVGESKENVLHV
jgi:hypothetical protein